MLNPLGYFESLEPLGHSGPPLAIFGSVDNFNLMMVMMMMMVVMIMDGQMMMTMGLKGQS